MSWLGALVDTGGVKIRVTEARFTQSSARLHSVGCTISAHAQQSVSRSARPHPADPVSHRSKVEWQDTELVLKGISALNFAVKITLTNRRRRFRTVIGTTSFTLRSLRPPTSGKDPFTRTLLLDTAFPESLNLKIELRIELVGLDSWGRLRPCLTGAASPRGAVVLNPHDNKNTVITESKVDEQQILGSTLGADLGNQDAPDADALSFSLSGDTAGVVFLEIVSVANLPKFRTLTGISFDMDPFVVMSFGRKVYKTPYRRHTLNPTFNCKVAFEVMNNEKQFSIVFAVWDMDRITLNDKVAETAVPVSEIMQHYAPAQNQQTKLYDLDRYVPAVRVVPLEHVAGTAELVLKAHYYPLAAIRQQMWRGVIGLYLGEPLSKTTTNSSDSLHAPQTDYPSFATTSSASSSSTTLLNRAPSTAGSLRGAIASKIRIKSSKTSSPEVEEPEQPMDADQEGLYYPQLKALLNSLGSTLSDDKIKQYFFRRRGLDPATSMVMEDDIVMELEEISKQQSGERIIYFRLCPICRQPGTKLGSHAVHHLSLCASRQWAESNSVQLDSQYVSGAQASKRWYANFLSKFSYGQYKLGAHSANILVQDRTSGQISEEKIAMVVRIGIRMIYSLGPVERTRFQKLLRRYTLKQGIKYSSPDSASQIEPFIKYHDLDMSEVLHPISKFKTFNEFFCRELKPGSRPCENEENPYTVVSPADCRLTIFSSVSSATELWIKGKNFSVEKLLADAYPQDAHRYVGEGCTVGVFRLAPQDYHRVHSPVEGVVGEPKHIEGHYYTVNPMAVRSSLDVFGVNARTVFPIISEQFGKVMVVMVGAMMVGSCIVTAKTGSFVKRTEELGYFQFGGSTVVLLFEKNRMIPDCDLATNSNLKIETLVKVGMSVGHAPGTPEFVRSYDTRHTTIRRAKSLISGGGAYLPFALD